MGVAACPPGVVDAPRIGAEIAAAMHGENLQVGMPLEYAIEDQIVQRDGRIERIADRVVEREPREPSRLAEAERVQHYQRAELLGLAPERRELGLGQFLAVHVGQDLDTLEAELADAALELLHGFAGIGHRHTAEPSEAVRLAGDELG